MKKVLLLFCCLALVLSVAACSKDPADASSNVETSQVGGNQGAESTDVAGSTTAGTTATDKDGKPVTTTTATDKNGKPVTTTTATDKNGNPVTTTTPVKDNVVDAGELLWPDDPTTTTATDKNGKPVTTTTATDKNGKPVTTTTATTGTTAPTYVPEEPKPTEIEKIKVPAVGTDLEDYCKTPLESHKNRLKVNSVEVKDMKLTLSVKLYTNYTTQEGTDYLRIACYDKNGKELASTSEMTQYIGCMEKDDVVSFTVALPKGTAEVKIVEASITYWTAWK